MSKQMITLNDGNKISFQSYGKGENILIFFHGILGGSWISDEWETVINNANVQLIALDRSGYGNSTKIIMESVSEWCSIARQIINHFHIASADVIGCSAGAPYAYATAYELPDIIKKVWILGGVPAVYEDNILQHYTPKNQIQYKKFITKTMTGMQVEYIEELKSFKKYLEENGEYYIKQTVEDNLNQHCFGMAQESKLQILPWKLRLSDIQQLVILRHALTDEMVPYQGAKEMERFFKNHAFKDIDISGEDVHRSSISKAFRELLSEYE